MVSKIFRTASCFAIVPTVIDRFSSVSSGLAILGMSLLVTVDIIGRFAFSRPTGVAVEVSGYLLVAMIFLGLAHTERRNRHIKITLLTALLPVRVRLCLALAMTLISIVVVGWLSWFTLQPVIQDYVLVTVSLTGMRTPQWIPQLAVPMGLLFFSVELVRRAALQVGDVRKSLGG